MISYDEAYKSCVDDPSMIFTLIKQENYFVIEELIDNNKVLVNIVDGVGNDVVTRLLRAHEYDLVIKLMKKRNWDVNHQNDDGNTFGHFLAIDHSVGAIKVMEQLQKKKNYFPNIKNNKGETALDLAVNNHYLYYAFKLIEDKRFNNIDVFSFKNLINACIKNSSYGKYSKINNLEVLVENMEKKDLNPTLRDLVDNISINMDAIKKDFMNNRVGILDSIINSHAVMA